MVPPAERRVENCQICFEDFEWIAFVQVQHTKEETDNVIPEEGDDGEEEKQEATSDASWWWWPWKVTIEDISSTFESWGASWWSEPQTPPLVLGSSLPCGQDHLFCSACLERYIDTQLSNSIWPVVCPREQCPEPISPFLVECLLGSKAMRWHTLGVERAIPRQIYCPNKDCNTMIDLGEEGSGSVKSKKNLMAAACPYCRHPFCALCLRGVHTGKTCAKVQKEVRNRTDRMDRAFEELAARSQWKKCPRCAHMVEKISGCNHIRCRCNYEFCYVCASPWSGRDGHDCQGASAPERGPHGVRAFTTRVWGSLCGRRQR